LILLQLDSIQESLIRLGFKLTENSQMFHI